MIETAEVLANIPLNQQFYCLDLHAPGIAAAAQPGQFAMVTVSKTQDPFLKRPMAFNAYDSKAGTIRFIYHVVGRGTALMAQFKPGEQLDLAGPFGQGWRIDPNQQRLLLIGGGAGISPLLPLARNLAAQGKEILTVLGGQTKQNVFCVDEFRQLGWLLLATEDGSLGEKGLVMDALPDDAAHEAVYACGPEAMLKSITAWAKARNLPCQVSLEAHMGCGLGTCMGCVCKIRKEEDSGVQYERICREGPVFDSREVVW